MHTVEPQYNGRFKASSFHQFTVMEGFTLEEVKFMVLVVICKDNNNVTTRDTTTKSIQQ